LRTALASSAQFTVHDAADIEISDREKGELQMQFFYTGKVNNPMDLKDFPFDEDSIDIRLVGRRMRDGRGANASDFVLRSKVCPQGGNFIRFYFDHHLPEYRLLGVSYVEYQKWGKSFITLGITVRRKHSYYFFKVTILMWLIVLLAMPTFLFEFAELEQRMALTATMFLATAATLYVVGQDLPKTENLNKMDLLLMGTLGVLFTVGAVSIAVFLLHRTDLAAAQAVQGFAVWALPALYLALNMALFACPCYRQWRRGPTPGDVRAERTFIPWASIWKVDPWSSGQGAKTTTAAGGDAFGAVEEVTMAMAGGSLSPPK
jgi:hypothetical protein